MFNKSKTFLIKTLHQKIIDNNLGKIDISELSDMFTAKKYSRKQILVHAGDKWEKVFFIQNGIIRLFYTDKNGREFNKGFFCEGSLVWPVAPSARSNNSLFYIAALEDTDIFMCSFKNFHSWLVKKGCWEKFALPYAELFADEKFLREYEFLMNSATQRLKNFYRQNPDLAQRIPDYHLAAYLGITNVSLSRIKKSINFNIC